MSRQTSPSRRIVLASAVLVAITIVAIALAYPTLEALSAIPSPGPRTKSSDVPSPKQTPDRPRQPPGGVSDRDPTVFGDGRSVTRLDPELLGALRRAATTAADDGVRLRVNSGWRSTAEQDRLFRAAVRTYGSDAEAARWVARPGTSPHEAGHAVDIGPTAAASWLARHGAQFGLCQIYRNEPWHYELRPTAVERGCPTTYADPTHDPRLGR